MHDNLGRLRFDDAPHRVRIAQIDLMKPRGGIHLMALAGAEVVDDRHLMLPARDQRIDGMRADKTGASGNQNFHRVVALLNRPAADRVVLELERLDEVGLI